MIDGYTTVWAIRILFTALSLITGYLIWSRWARFDRITSFLLAPLGSVALIILVATPLYWMYRFDEYTLFAVIAVLCLVSIIASIRPLPTKQAIYLPIRSLVHNIKLDKSQQLPTYLFAVLYICVLLISVFLLLQGRTIDATLGPWERAPILFFIAYGAASFLLLALSYLQKLPTVLHTILLVLHGIVLLSILGIIFPLGYGFDPFLHRAAESAIQQYGVIAPKTLYYIGQYVSVAAVSMVLGLPIFVVDMWLVPLLAGISILPLAVFTIRKLITSTHLGMVLAALVFIIPFPSLINTTPWSLSLLFFICTFLLLLLYSEKQSKSLLAMAWIGVMCAAFIHPLGGIPTLIIASLVTIFYECIPRIQTNSTKILLGCTTIIVSSILVPLAFMLNGLFSSQLGVHIALPANPLSWMLSVSSTIFSYTSHFNVWQDIAYLLPLARGGILLAAAVGVTAYYWNTQHTYRIILTTLWACWIALFLNFILLSGFVRFDSLISYEQSIFSHRLYEASVIILLPFGMIALYGLVRRLFATSSHYPFLKIVSLIFFAGLMTANMYASYPKRDAYNTYHGYTISQTDIETVRWINNHAGDRDHIVLANQVMAASAIQEFGFKHYYQREINGAVQEVFYYPTPTSSPLYADYRAMLAAPSQEKAADIMYTYGIKQLYVIVNHYEPQYQGTNNKLNSAASAVHVIRIGKSENTIFVFEVEQLIIP